MADKAERQSPLAYPVETRGLNFFESDRNLIRLLRRRAPGLLKRYAKRLSDFGAWAGGPLDEQAAYSVRYAPPRLEAFGPRDERLGRVILNPAYQACHQEAYRRGVIGLAFAERPAPHVLSFVMGNLLSHSDIAIHCPVTMTGAVAYVLSRLAPAKLRRDYLPGLVRMDGQTQTGGTWATELHGGSDVGATTTRARADGAAWRLNGLKWFTSNAGAGLALATARPRGAPPGGKGLGCYLVPDVLPDGTPNALWVRRLKDKLGTRALATGEVELDGAWAREVAGPPHGLKVMMEALEYSRIHNAVAACGAHRRAFLEAVCWASHRHAFGSSIARYPMVRDTLLDLAMAQEAGTALAFEAAFTFDAALKDERQRPWLRTVTALAKYRTAEAAVEAARRALELVGGNGYTEDWPTARLYRDTMVLSVWEGPANIQALELLRVVLGKGAGGDLFLKRLQDIEDALPAALADEAGVLREARGDCAQALSHLRAHERDGPRHARRLMDLMADTLSAALLLEEAAADLKMGDKRKLLIARRYLAAQFGGRAPISAKRDSAQSAFARVIGYAIVEA